MQTNSAPARGFKSDPPTLVQLPALIQALGEKNREEPMLKAGEP
jgi:hypothetical protein